MIDLRQEFFLPSGHKGCLVLHGYTSAPAVVYRHRYINLAGIVRFWVKEYAWPVETRPKEESKYLLHYPRFPMVSVHYMTRLQRLARARLSDVKADTLLILARNDTLVHVRTDKILRKKFQVPITTVWLEKSGHSVAVECEKETVFTNCIEFINKPVTGTASAVSVPGQVQ